VDLTLQEGVWTAENTNKNRQIPKTDEQKEAGSDMRIGKLW